MYKSGENPFAENEETAKSYGSGENPFAEESGFIDELGRQAGLTGRAALNILSSPVQIAGNFVNKGLNTVLPESMKLQMPGDIVQEGMDKIGLPQPEGFVEELTQHAAKSAPAFALPGGIVAQTAGNAAIEGALAPEGETAQAAGLGGIGGAGGHFLGNAISKLGKVPGIVKSGYERFIEPWTDSDKSMGKVINRVTGDKRDAVIDALRNSANDSQVPGFERSAGQSGAVPANSPDFAYLQSIVEGQRPDVYTKESLEGLGGQQNKAVTDVLRGISGTDQDLAVAMNQRRSATKPLYGDVEGMDVEVSDELLNVLERPTGREATGVAGKLAGNEDRAFDIMGEPAGTSNILGPDGNPIPTPAEPGVIGGRDMQVMDQSFGDLIQSARANNTGSNMARSIGKVRDDFMTEAEELIPELKIANDKYRELSRPINTMEAARDINKTAITPKGDMQPGAFSQALRKEGALDDIPFADRNRYGTVQDELSNSETFKNMAKEGRASGADRLFLDPVMAPGAFMPMVTMGRSVINKIMEAGTEKNLTSLGEIMRDPVLVAQLMSNAPPAEKKLLQHIANKVKDKTGKMLPRVGAITGAATLNEL